MLRARWDARRARSRPPRMGDLRATSPSAAAAAAGLREETRAAKVLARAAVAAASLTRSRAAADAAAAHPLATQGREKESSKEEGPTGSRARRALLQPAGLRGRLRPDRLLPGGSSPNRGNGLTLYGRAARLA